jgi:histidyl-tRNA synthetase
VQASALESAQNGIGGGGRYDGLVELLGGPPTPGIGFGTGVERVLLACDAEGVFPAPASPVQVFVVDSTGGEEARDLTAELRRAGVACDRAYDGRSMKAQFRAADRSGARLAVVIGTEERTSGKVKVQALDADRTELVDRAEVVAHVRRVLGG